MSYNKPVISLGQIEIDASKFKSQPSYDNIPLLPMRDQMIFPGVTFPIALGRESSINAAEYASENGIPLCIACQKNGSENSPKLPDDVYKYGVVAHVIKVIDIPDGPKTALIHANSICEITGYGTNPLPGDFITASTLPVKEIAAPDNDNEFLAIISAVKNTASEIAHIIAEENHEITYNIDQCSDPLLLLNIVSTFMPFDPATKFHILETFNPKQRAFIVLTELERQRSSCQ